MHDQRFNESDFLYGAENGLITMDVYFGRSQPILTRELTKAYLQVQDPKFEKRQGNACLVISECFNEGVWDIFHLTPRVKVHKSDGCALPYLEKS